MPGRTGAIRAGRAQVELYADDSQLARGLNRAGIRLKAFGAAVQAAGIKMLGVGGAIVAPMLGASKVFADVGSQVLDMSKRTGLSTEALSVLGYAADQTGASMESLEGSIRRMQRAIGEAVAGQKAYQDAFAVLGLNAAKLAALSPEEQFKAIGGAIGAIQNPALRTAAAMQMFGRAGTGILPMLEGGAAGMKAFEQQAKKLQQVISGPEAQAADRLGDAYQDIKKAVTALARGIGSALAPLLTEVGKKVALNIALAAKWVKEHRGMIVSVLKLGVGLMAAGAALIAFGIALRGVGSVLHVAAVVVGALVTVAGFLVTPIGAATAAIAGFSTAVLWASGAGGFFKHRSTVKN